MLCPCCSGEEYSLCCSRWLNELALPPDPIALMRSRYVAYVQKNVRWLEETWHPLSRPTGLASYLKKDADIHWLELKVIGHEISVDGNTGYVTFSARYADTRPGFIYERSRFVYEGERWYYVDGTFPTLRRNDRCLCGSGQKFKKCCGQ